MLETQMRRRAPCQGPFGDPSSTLRLLGKFPVSRAVNLVLAALFPGE